MRRFFSFVLLVAFFLLALWLNENRHRARRVPEKFTPATEPLVDLKNVQVLAAMDGEYTRLVASVVPSVVSIATSRTVHVPVVDPFDLLFGRRARREYLQKQSALGSGVIVSKEGHVLTNNHVIAGMEEILVELSDGRSEPASVIGADSQTDIAVLKINARDVKPLPLGDSDQVRVGQMVSAIGNPLGLQETITRGIISAKRRPAEDSATEYFQTDAAINPGNSGGPLINMRGEIIGINTWIASQTGGSQGLGFAVPSNTARRVLDAVLKHGVPEAANPPAPTAAKKNAGQISTPLALAGVVISEIPDSARASLPENVQGVMITKIAPDAPAAGTLQPGDVIEEINRQPVQSLADVEAVLKKIPRDGRVVLFIARGRARSFVVLQP